MSKKILIDLMKCRECASCTAECAYVYHPNNRGIMAIKEIAAFRFTCRNCDLAPCIDVCPEEALAKNMNGIVTRSLNLCVACKSCVAVCPFGTLLDDCFEVHHSICDFCELTDQTSELLCVNTCPNNALELVDREENIDEHIYTLNDKVLVREFPWEKLLET